MNSQSQKKDVLTGCQLYNRAAEIKKKRLVCDTGITSSARSAMDTKLSSLQHHFLINKAYKEPCGTIDLVETILMQREYIID